VQKAKGCRHTVQQKKSAKKHWQKKSCKKHWQKSHAKKPSVHMLLKSTLGSNPLKDGFKKFKLVHKS